MQEHDADWLSALRTCVERFIREKNYACAELSMSPLSGDAGFRRYFRCNTCPSLIAVYAPPETEKNSLFCRIAAHLNQAEVRAPEVLWADFMQGFLILEDFGDALLLDELNPDSVNTLYQLAFDTLQTLQKVSCDESLFERYSETLLNAETALFDEWYLAKLLGLELDEREREIIAELVRFLTARACNQKQVLVHRDFHSRNLMLLDDGGLGVIDFQDAVVGPLTYDLVSLLKDCYVRWNPLQVERWALAYLEQLYAQGVTALDRDEFLKDFHLMGMQRHLKVLGIFARLSLRDGKHGYLADLPTVMAYVLEASAMFPELAPFDVLLRARILPLAQEKGWAH